MSADWQAFRKDGGVVYLCNECLPTVELDPGIKPVAMNWPAPAPCDLCGRRSFVQLARVGDLHMNVCSACRVSERMREAAKRLALVLLALLLSCGPLHVEKPRRFAVAVTNTDGYDYTVTVRAWGPGFVELTGVVPKLSERVFVFGAIPDLVEIETGSQRVSWTGVDYGSWWVFHVVVPSWSSWCDAPVDRSFPPTRPLRGL